MSDSWLMTHYQLKTFHTPPSLLAHAPPTFFRERPSCFVERSSPVCGFLSPLSHHPYFKLLPPRTSLTFQ
jgi:hypothetical protein